MAKDTESHNTSDDNVRDTHAVSLRRRELTPRIIARFPRARHIYSGAI